ncbi:MAG: FAD-binding and (Fe-S)-binding domain-containing protein [Planctomycetota bacterium]
MAALRDGEARDRYRGTIRDDEIARSLYASNASICYRRPAAVAVPTCDDDVVLLMDLAQRFGVPVTPRGAGSSVAGQSLGDGLIIDFSPRMNRLLEVDVARRRAVVEPGLIRDRLNVALQSDGLWFPPDPSSGSFCTLGGMIANNSGGAHSLKYGTTKHYVERLDLVLVGGARISIVAPARDDLPAPLLASEASVAPLEAHGLPPTGNAAGPADSPLAQITAQIAHLVTTHRDTLARERPRTIRSSCGYNLFEVETADGLFDLTRLLCGSEGTLAILLRATLRLIPPPAHRTGITLDFDDELAAYRTVPQIVAQFAPSTVQAMSRDLLLAAATGAADEARARPAPTAPAPSPPDDTLAVKLLVEFDGDDLAALHATAANCLATVAPAPARAGRLITSPDELSNVWIVRKSAAAVLSRMPGPARPTRWIEDGAVPPDRLADFVAGLRKLFADHGIDAALFGHADQGLLHFSPPMDPHSPDHVERLQRISDAHAQLLRAVGGVPSGEHGDGLLRTPLLPAVFPQSYPLFVEAKRSFDPAHLLNPAIIVPSPAYATATLADHLRYGHDYAWSETQSTFDAPALRAAVELCHGCGSCRSYCPVVGLGDDEQHLPRAKANVLRDLISGRLDATTAFAAPPGEQTARGVIDHCLNCGLCLDRCPTHVDIPGISNAFRAEWSRAHGGRAATRADQLLARPARLSRFGAVWPAAANALLRARPVRRVMQWITGISARAALPAFSRERLHATAVASEQPARLWDRDVREVAIFVGCEQQHADQQEVRALVAILAHLGIRSQLVQDAPCCTRPMSSVGLADDARPLLQHHRDRILAHWRAGRPWLVLTPSCLPPFVHDLRRLRPDDADLAEAVRGCLDAGEFVAAVLAQRDAATTLRDEPVAIHTPCSLRSVHAGNATRDLLRRAGFRTLMPIDVPCCGALGTFSLKAAHIDDARTIARGIVDSVARLRPAPTVIASPAGNCRRWITQQTGLPVEHPLVLVARNLNLS